MTQDKIKELLDDSEYLTQEYSSEGVESHYKVDKIEAAKEIYKLHLEEKLHILEHFRTTLLSEGCPKIADEYFEQVGELQEQLKNI